MLINKRDLTLSLLGQVGIRDIKFSDRIAGVSQSNVSRKREK